MTKAEVIAELREQLKSRIKVTKSALADSSESANGEQTKSEGKYDTRAIEASYLAEAQAEQLALAEESLAILQRFEPRDFAYDDLIEPGALVEVDQDGEICFYLLAPTGGGLTTNYLGCEVTVITPEAQLYQNLSDKKLGDSLESPPILITGVE